MESRFQNIESVQDAFGNEVEVGDTIAWVQSVSHHLQKGQVTKLQHDPDAKFYDGSLRPDDAWAVTTKWEPKYSWEKGTSRIRDLNKIVKL